jgi:hypothetical protein
VLSTGLIEPFSLVTPSRSAGKMTYVDREFSSTSGVAGMILTILILCVALLLASAVEQPATPEKD